MAAAPHASLFITLAMWVLPLTMIGAWLGVLAGARVPDRSSLLRRFAVILVGWSSLWLVLAAVGALADLERRPPLFITLVPLMLVGVALLSRSRIGRVLAFERPLWVLIVMQSFRLPLELVMHAAASEGVMPVQMTFGDGGLNYDIITGATALVLGLALRGRQLSRGLLLAWNATGLLLLVNIVVVAVLSTPLFARFGNAPLQLNTWVLHAPFVWLPAVLVASALLGHVLIFKKLLTSSAQPAAAK